MEIRLDVVNSLLLAKKITSQEITKNTDNCILGAIVVWC